MGFGDYQPDETLPILEQALENPRASSGEHTKIEVGAEPGSAWRYSGGGCLILELLIEEVCGETFEANVELTLLQPLNMTRSGYDTAATTENSARSYDVDGRSVAVNRNASTGATGFAASAGGLAKFVLAQLASPATTPIDTQTMKLMRQPEATTLGVVVAILLASLYYMRRDAYRLRRAIQGSE